MKKLAPEFLKHISVYLDDGTYERLKAEALISKYPLSIYVRILLKYFDVRPELKKEILMAEKSAELAQLKELN